MKNVVAAKNEHFIMTGGRRKNCDDDEDGCLVAIISVTHLQFHYLIFTGKNSFNCDTHH